MELKNKLLSTGMFEDNEFLDKYCELITSNQDSTKTTDTVDSHHIMPKAYYSLVGAPTNNKEENLVNLTYSNHVLAHYYLCLFTNNELLKEKMIYAFMMMIHTREFPESEVELLQHLSKYDDLRDEWIEHLRVKMKNNQHAKGNILSEETRRQMGASRMGHSTSDETRDKISKAHCGRKWMHKGDEYTHVRAEDVCEYLMNGWELGGHQISEEQKQAISAKNTGKKRSEESKVKMSIAAQGRQPWNKGVPQSDVAKMKNSESHKNRTHINNGVQEKFVTSDLLQDYLNVGWVKGRITKSRDDKKGDEKNEK